MPYINKELLDGELRSQLNFECIPIYEGGILSGVSPAPPFEDGVRFLPGVDASAYVRFKATQLMVDSANLWIYCTFYGGASTEDFDIDVYYQKMEIGSSPAVVGPISTTITPDGSSDLQTTITVINNNVVAWRVPATIQRNSMIRFEIVRRGTTDLNPDELRIMDISYATIPTYQTLSTYGNGLNQPVLPLPTGTNILNNKGDLLSHDGSLDVAIAHPGVADQVLVTTNSGSTCLEWVDKNTVGGGAGLLEFSGVILTADTILADTDVETNHFVNNPSLVSSITLTLPPTAGLDNGTPIAFYNLTVNPNGHKVVLIPAAGDSLYDNGGLAANIQMGNAAGETVILRTDGNDWYNLNRFPENPNAPFDICDENPVFPGDSVTFTLSSAALPPFYMFVNNILYSSPTHFTVTGAGNTTWTWLNTLFPLIASDEIRLIYNCGGLGSGTMATEQFTAGAAQTLFTLTQDAQPPFFFYVNGNAYLTPSSFTVAGAGNRDWTWLDVDFVMSGGEEILLQFFVP